MGAALLFSLAITLVLYSIFPICFAMLRKKSISRRKYLVFCYCFNLIPMAVAVSIAGSSTGGPYLIWTWFFAKVIGLNQLEGRGVLSDAVDSAMTTEQPPEDGICTALTAADEKTEELQDSPDTQHCRKCGKELVPGAVFCLECGEKVSSEEVTTAPEEQTVEVPADEYQIKFCHHCGYKLMENSRFCSNCGAEING